MPDPDPTALTDAVTRLADRLRAMPQSTLSRGPAAEALELAGRLAMRAQQLEFPGQQPRPMPDAGPFAVGDQLEVAVHDLTEALRHADAPTGRDALDEAGRLVEEAAPRITAKR